MALRSVRAAALALVVWVLMAPASAVLAKEGATWEQWQHVAGIFDAVPSSDGIFLALQDGRIEHVVQGPSPGISSWINSPVLQTNTEAYIAASAGLELSDPGCKFPRDEIWAIHPGAPIEVDDLGSARTRVPISGVESLNGIVFDTAGAFGHRLLVTGPNKGKTVVVAIDCKGGKKVVTDSAPSVEGGLAVAPASFGSYGGALIAPDEASGRVFAIKADGSAMAMLDTTTGLGNELPGASGSLPKGGDIGAESLGFVPPGFIEQSGFAYLADRGTPGNPHPGTDSLLRLTSDQLSRAIVSDGDLLVATEGGAFTADITCGPICGGRVVAHGPPTAHPEGHIAFAFPVGHGSSAAAPTLPGESGRSGFNWWLVAVPVIVIAAAALAYALRQRMT